MPGLPCSPLVRAARAHAFPIGLTWPAVAFVATLGLWPLAAFLLGSVESTAGGLTLDRYRQLLSDGLFAEVAARTVLTSLGVTLLALVLGYPLAYVLARAKGHAKTLLIVLVALPYLTSVLVRVYAWAALLALDGPVNRLLVALGIFDAPRLLGHSLTGTVIGMVHILCPIAVLTLWSQLEKVDRGQMLTAQTLGASRMRAFLTVYLPQSAPGLKAAGSIVYVLALGAYVIPAALGGTKGLMFAQLVVEQATNLLDWETSGAMGAMMLVAAAVPMLALNALRLVGRRRRASVTPLQHALARYLHRPLDRVPLAALRTALWIVVGATLTLLALPELVVLVFSVGAPRQVVLPPTTITLDGYRAVLTDPAWLRSGQRSLVYALIDALIAAALGTMAAYGFARGPRGWARIGILVLLAPLVLPEILPAISFFVFATKAQLAGTDAGIVLGQAVGTIGLVAVVVGAVMRSIDINLEHAARACGASRARALRDVVLPLLAPGLLVGFLYGFLHAFDNLVTPLFIAGAKPTITVKMFLTMQEELTSAPAVIASLLLLLLIAGLAVAAFAHLAGRRWVPLPAPAGPTGNFA